MAPSPRHRRDRQRSHAKDQRDHRRRPWRPVQADEQATQAGVRDRVTRDPHDVVEAPPQPEVAGVPWEHREPERDGGGERRGRHQRGTPPTDQQQVDDEQRGRQLDAGDQADSDTGPLAPLRPEQVGHHDGQNHQVDLSELQRQSDGLEPRDQTEQQGTDAPQTRLRRHSEPTEQPQHHERHQCGVHRQSQDLSRQRGDERQRQEAQGGERAVVEEQGARVPGQTRRVEIVTGDHLFGTEPVDLQVDLACQVRPAQIGGCVHDEGNGQDGWAVGAGRGVRSHQHPGEDTGDAWTVPESRGCRRPLGRRRGGWHGVRRPARRDQ